MLENFHSCSSSRLRRLDRQRGQRQSRKWAEVLNMENGMGVQSSVVAMQTSSVPSSSADGARVESRSSVLLALGYVLIGVGLAVVISSLVG
jgi:hypothetical protein